MTTWFMVSPIFGISPAGRVLYQKDKEGGVRIKNVKETSACQLGRDMGIALNAVDGHNAGQWSGRPRYSSITICTAFLKDAGALRYFWIRSSSSGFSLCSVTGSILCGISVYPIR